VKPRWRAARSSKATSFAVELDDRRLIASVVAVDDKRHVFLQGNYYILLRDDPLHLVEAGGAQAAA
jgi:3-methylcrotonyl-CoA carboxylase alpha subunit